MEENYRTRLEGDWIIMPTPTDEKHILERGFDHTEYLAEIVGQVLLPDARVLNGFQRNRKTEANANLLDPSMQKGNIRGSIELRISDLELRGKQILLVDDVVTSGATMGECARVLRRAGVRRVEGFAFCAWWIRKTT